MSESYTEVKGYWPSLERNVRKEYNIKITSVISTGNLNSQYWRIISMLKLHWGISVNQNQERNIKLTQDPTMSNCHASNREGFTDYYRTRVTTLWSWIPFPNIENTTVDHKATTVFLEHNRHHYIPWPYYRLPALMANLHQEHNN